MNAVRIEFLKICLINSFSVVHSWETIDKEQNSIEDGILIGNDFENSSIFVGRRYDPFFNSVLAGPISISDEIFKFIDYHGQDGVYFKNNIFSYLKNLSNASMTLFN